MARLASANIIPVLYQYQLISTTECPRVMKMLSKSIAVIMKCCLWTGFIFLTNAMDYTHLFTNVTQNEQIN